MRRLRLLSLAMVLATGCTTDDPDGPTADGDETETLDPGGPLGKEDSAGVPSLPVTGDYASTQAWTVANQWEDTTTAEAKKAGMAWGENSGLTWDQKFSLWVGSFQQVESIEGWFKTIAISTPFQKAVNGPKVDCADLSLLLRITFAAWYRLPIYFVGYDGNTPIYFGHFGVRTEAGKWSEAPSFGAQFADPGRASARSSTRFTSTSAPRGWSCSPRPSSARTTWPTAATRTTSCPRRCVPATS